MSLITRFFSKPQTQRSERRLHNHRPCGHKRTTAALRLERLEDRLALSGFGADDGAYIVEPWEGLYNSVQIRASDQAILAGGQFGRAVYNTRSASMAVERYDAQGNADDTFVSGGPATVPAPTGYFNATGSAIALQSDGKVVIAGYFTQSNDWDVGVARLNASGQLDSTYGSGGRTAIDTASNGIGGDEYASAVALQSTGKAVVAGYSNSYGLVGRLTTSGALDKGKGAFGDVQKGSGIGYTRPMLYAQGGSLTAAVVAPDNKIVAVGSTLARFTADGALDSTFGKAPTSGTAALPAGVTGRAISLQPDGKIVVSGRTTSNQVFVARYTATGTLDTSFGAGSGYVVVGQPGNYGGSGVAIQPDGKIVVSGNAVDYYGTEVGASGETIYVAKRGVVVARLNANGTPDTSFGDSGYKTSLLADYRGTVKPTGLPLPSPGGLALQTDGSIIVAGQSLSTSDSITHPLLVRFFGTNVTSSPSASSSDATGSAIDDALMLLLTDTSTTTTKRK